jgi:hypothetical protein
MTFFFNILLQIFIIIIFLLLFDSVLKILFTYHFFDEVLLISTGSIITKSVCFFIDSGSYSDTDIECQKIGETRRILEAICLEDEVLKHRLLFVYLTTIVVGYMLMTYFIRL